MEAELATADKYLDYFEVLWSDPTVVGSDSECLWPADPNLRPCTDTALAFMLNTTVWSRLSGRLRFFVSYSNDFDGSGCPACRGMFAGPKGALLWSSFVATWVAAFAHPQYLRVGGRPLFKILGPYNLLQVACGGNVTLVQERVATLRRSAVAAGVGDPLIGGGWIPANLPMPTAPYQGVLYDFTGKVACGGHRDESISSTCLGMRARAVS